MRGTHHEGLLELLNEMNSSLESIQRSLDMYLETKRQCFPRFYFLSNDDLLEILGQSKNPEAVSCSNSLCERIGLRGHLITFNTGTISTEVT